MYSHPDKPGKIGAFSFGTEKRNKIVKNNLPGPGQYHIPSTIADVPKYIMSGGSFDPGFKYI
jgi:hypothetical protein